MENTDIVAIEEEEESINQNFERYKKPMDKTKIKKCLAFSTAIGAFALVIFLLSRSDKARLEQTLYQSTDEEFYCPDD